MRNLRYISRLIWAFLTRFKAIIGIGIILGIIIFLIIDLVFPVILSSETQRIGVAGRFNVNTLPINILNKISSGLTKLDDAGNVLPDLAESWSTPDNGKTWIFKLKKDVLWQDGTNLVSKDVNYQFSDATIARPDSQTVVFGLQNPYSAFPTVVVKPIFKAGLLGTNEWKVKHLNIISDFVNQITLEDKNKNKIIYKFYPNEENVKLAFQLGQIDSVVELFDPKPLDKWPKAKIISTVNRGEYVAVLFNNEDPLFKNNKTLKQALSYATNKDNFGQERAIGPISSMSWAFNPQIKQYNYDPIKAKTMIDTVISEMKSDINITLTTSPLLLSKTEMIQKDWEAVGIKAKVQVVSNIPSNYQAMVAIFDIPDDPDQYSMWHSTQSQTNITHYSNPRIDKLLEDGRTSLDPMQRKQIYYDFQRFLLEDAPTMFLYYPTIYTINRNSI